MRKRVFIVIRKKYFKALFPVLLLCILISLAFIGMIYLKDKQTDSTTKPAGAGPANPKLAIIIDDFGEARGGIKEMMSINRHLTFAIMPFLTYSGTDATEAHKKGYEVIVHLSMQASKNDVSSWLGPRPIKTTFTASEIRGITSDALNSIPFAIGANIHMGSESSESRKVMSSVLRVINMKSFYFVDSKTSKNSVCRQVAGEFGTRFAERDIFLESPSKTKSYIKSQLIAAANIAKKRGYAVAIGHVGAEGGKVTAEAIQESIPLLEAKGIDLVYVSELLK